jgi:hypothetical protein
MVEFISDKFNEIVKKCLEKNAVNFKVDKNEVQLILKFDSNNELEYLISKMYKAQRSISFKEVLGVKLDLKGYSLFVPKFIKGALKRFSEEYKIETSRISVMIFMGNNNNLNLWLYDDVSPIKEIKLASLFDTEDMTTEEDI